MSLTDNQCPPVLDGLVQIIKEKGSMEHEEFRRMLFGLRIEKDDVVKIERWLIEKGYVKRIIGGKEKQQRRDYIVFALFHIEEK
jgi:hypothetical protein